MLVGNQQVTSAILKLNFACEGTAPSPKAKAEQCVGVGGAESDRSRVVSAGRRGQPRMEPAGPADGEDEPGPPARLAPSPHSEAVAHELRELSLQPSPCLPPLTERKNGE